MDDPQELFYWVDDQDKVLGSIARSEAHTDPNKIHRAVYVLVTSNAGDMLFQKRSLYKDLYPAHWALSCAGHVTYGKDYRQAAEDEAFEELGIHPHLYYVTKTLIRTEQEVEQCQIYLCKVDTMPEHFNKTEIDELKWVAIKEISDFIAGNPLPPADIEVLRLLMYIK